jgi:hypothetical protein
MKTFSKNKEHDQTNGQTNANSIPDLINSLLKSQILHYNIQYQPYNFYKYFLILKLIFQFQYKLPY